MCLPQNVVRPRRGCSRRALFETMVRDALCPPPRISEPGTCWVGVQAWVVVIETGCMKRLSAVYACTDCHIVYRTVLHTTPNPPWQPCGERDAKPPCLVRMDTV